MFFDDRLATVLRQRATSDAALRTQFRQLLDILGAERAGTESSRDPSLVASAWLRMDALAAKIPSSTRARIIREAGWRFRSPELAAHLADFEPEVASAALNRAQLSADEWAALIPRLPVRARGFLRLRRDLPVDIEALLERLGVHDRGLPSPQEREEERKSESAQEADFGTEDKADASSEPDPASAPPSDPANAVPPILDLEEELPARGEGEDAVDARFERDKEGRSEISALVERIAQFRRNREAADDSDASDNERMPRLPLGEEPSYEARLVSSFGFASDAGGRIEWADPEVAPMVIGTRLVTPPRLGSSGQDGPLGRAFTRRQPILETEASLAGADAIAGQWIVDAQPRFTDDGNFAGYVGRFRRPADADPNRPSPAQREADRIRQLLHELRTPVTAVQGYAEVIQQQLFGTAPHEYRALAAAIAADAARILSGFEELDRLAKIESGAIAIGDGTSDLGSQIHRTVAQLSQVLGSRMAGIEIEAEPDEPIIVAVEQDEADSLLWRLLATLGGGCSAGELLRAELSIDKSMGRFTCELPAQLLAEDNIFTAEVRPIGTTINAGLFGAGFALRLARAEARSASGDLTRDDETVILTLPIAATNQDEEADGTIGTAGA